MKILTDWFRRYLSDPQLVFLTLLVLGVFAVVVTMGDMLAPVLASIVIAYLLEGLVGPLQRLGWPRLPSVLLVYVSFLLFLALVLFGVLPLASRQVTELVQQLRGTADKRQVEGARLALQHNLGLGGACVVTMYEKV
jgi:putative permease